jgi:predicted  nucleic acid-binding Zn-ribbon protein
VATPFEKQCWKCGASFPQNERHCPDCGADSWNRPQGAKGRISNAGSPKISEVYAHSDSVAITTATGVFIIAMLMSLGFWAGVAAIVVNEVNTTTLRDGLQTIEVSESFSVTDYIVVLIVAVAMTVVTWRIASAFVGDE